MKLGEHLNSLLLNMCDDVTLSRMSLRTVLDICSKHIQNSSCDPPFSYVRKLVRLVLGSLSQVDALLSSYSTFPVISFSDCCWLVTQQWHFKNVCLLKKENWTPVAFLSLLLPLFFQLDGLLTDRESLPERSKEIRERLRGKGLPSGKMS